MEIWSKFAFWPHLAVKGLFNNLYYTEAMAREALYFDFSPPPISISITPKYTAIRGRKMCTRQSRKVLWVVLSVLLFKEI